MNLAISPVKYSNNTYNKAVKQNKISFAGNIENDIKKTLGEATLAVLAVTIIGGRTYKHTIQEQQERQTKMLNSLSQKLEHPDIFEVDTVFADKDGKVNVVMNNKVNGKVYRYDLINSRQYIEYPPKGTGIMHDYKSGKDYIKYKGKYIPSGEFDNTKSK